ncbi:glycosyltransferase [Lacticaseibacillus sp. N501-2]|uniref:glycosyltransferase n=1 Tax=Lacticaseibacillus salsurae TaxID=3367729 RepID=UPI0038B26139
MGKMNYFVGRGIDLRLTGIEQAQLNRLHLFEKYGQRAKILRFTYSRNAHQDAARFGLNDSQLCNMFDWLQHAETFSSQPVLLRDVVEPTAELRAAGVEGDVSAVNMIVNRRVVKQVRYTTATQQVQQVLVVDGNGKVTHTDSYDSRGFLSRRSLFSTTGKHYADDYFTPDGESVLHVDYKGDSHFGIRQLVSADGTVYAHAAELQGVFLHTLAAQEPARFFYDRGYQHEMLTSPQLPAEKYLMVHNDHRAYTSAATASEQAFYDRVHAPYKPETHPAAYLSEFADPGDLSGIIVSTSRQKAAIQADYPDLKTPMAVAPVGIADPMPAVVSWASRDASLLIAVTRISPEKGLLDLIDAFIKIHRHNPKAHLEVYGAPSGDIGRGLLAQLHAELLQAGMDNDVAFMGFRKNLDAVYDRAGMMLMTSATEGFNIALEEALSHGVPAVSYDVDYGPRDMITPGVNGELVPHGDVNGLAQQVLDLLADPTRQQNLSAGAYRQRSQFSAANVWAGYARFVSEK